MTPPVDLYFAKLSAAADRLRNTAYSRFKTDLNRYLKALAAHPLAVRAIANLEGEADLQGWLDDLGDLFAGDPPVFPDDARTDAAIRLGLMRLFAKDVEEATEFGIRLSTAHDYETLVEAVNETVIRPLAEDLPDILLHDIQRLERNGTHIADVTPTPITATPGRPPWSDVLHSLDALAEALRSAPENPDRTQALAELIAGTALIRSGRFRPHALRSLLITDDGPLRSSWPDAAHKALAIEAARLTETALAEGAYVQS